MAAAQILVLEELFSTFVPQQRQAMFDYLNVLDLPALPSALAGGEHAALVQAIWDRDPERAASNSRDHLDRMLNELSHRGK
jgi:DNA-binding FadR family transcriptional regulator